jgi:ABC-type nitrate/sulfonate/bicarbonate transport system permease component
MPVGARDFANIILGFLLGTAVATIISFFYGSSKSSKDKTEMMKADNVKPA